MKLAICLGGSKTMYEKDAEFFKYFKEDLKFEQIEKYIYKKEDVLIHFFFYFGQFKNKILEKQKRQSDDEFPKTADNVLIDMKKFNPDKVLFFGICGSLLDNNLFEIIFPTEFFSLKTDKFLEQDIPTNKLKLNNILGRSNEKVISLTSFMDNWDCFVKKQKNGEFDWNYLKSKIEKELTKENIGSFSKKQRINYKLFLSQYGDVIEMESWMIVNSLKNKYPLGVMLMISDTIKDIDQDIRSNMKKNWNNFRNNVFEIIKIVIYSKNNLNEIKKTINLLK